MSLIGAVLLLASLVYGQTVSETPALAAWFTLSATQLALAVIGYGFFASVLPVWLLLAPRDYLSTFLKVGTILLLAIGIIIVRPELQMPAVTKFIDGSGPGLGGEPVPVPVHHHRLRGGQRLAFADLVGHHAEDDREREPDPLHRLWRDADGIVRRDHGDDRRDRDPPGRLFRHEQLGRPDRGRSRARGRGHLRLGVRGDAGHAGAGRARGRRDDRSCRAPAARRRLRSAWRASSPASSAARRWRASGTTSPSCSRPCSSSPPSTRARASAGS